MDVFSKETALVHKVLDSVETRAKVAMHNIANQSTPGFKRYEVEFADLLQQARAAGTDVSNVSPKVTRDESGTPGANNVDVMQEFRDLDEVKFLQQIFLMRSSGYFSHIRKAITGRA